MSFEVRISEKADKQLAHIDSRDARFIMAWVRKNLEGCKNPRAKGKALAGSLKDAWCYRVGDYRILANILDGKLIILLITIGNRHDVYRQR